MVFPPDDMHPIASLSKDDAREPIEMTIECKNCHEFTTIYWGRRARSEHKGSAYAYIIKNVLDNIFA
jgi:hypothetical protein